MKRWLVFYGAIFAAAGAWAVATGPVLAQTTASSPVTHTGGIWKAAVPAKTMHGEFESFDPIGVAAGAKIKADCSLNWISPDDHKLYCFSSGTSLEFFLDEPHASIARAEEGWRKLTAQSN